MRKLFAAAATAALIVGMAPLAHAAEGSVTVPVPIVDCDYTVYWDVDARDPLATDAGTYGTCSG